MKSSSKFIKVVYNDGKCYNCNGTNISYIKKNGNGICNDCSIEIVVFDYITEEEYKYVFSLTNNIVTSSKTLR
jgi:hypothetical protein